MAKKNYDCEVCGVTIGSFRERKNHERTWEHRDKQRAASEAAYQARQREEAVVRAKAKFAASKFAKIELLQDHLSGYRQTEQLIESGLDKATAWMLHTTARTIADTLESLRRELGRMRDDIDRAVGYLGTRGSFIHSCDIRMSTAADIMEAVGRLKDLPSVLYRMAAQHKVRIDVATPPDEWALLESLARWQFVTDVQGRVEASHLMLTDADTTKADGFFAETLDDALLEAEKRSAERVRQAMVAAREEAGR